MDRRARRVERLLATDHWEKGALAAVAVAVLILAAEAPWRVDPRRPAELVSLVDAARREWTAAPWPAADRKQFALRDWRAEVGILLGDMETSRYALSTPTIWPVVPPPERFREPEWLPVTDLIADPVRPILAKAVSEPAPAAPNALGVAPPPMFETADFILPTHAVTLRGVVDAEAQRRAIAAAGPRGRLLRGEEPVEYLDFEIERQRAGAGSDAWEQPWERLDLRDARDVLMLTRGTDADPYARDHAGAAVHHPVFTMPLPSLFVGTWDAVVRHPQIDAWLNAEGSRADPARQQDGSDPNRLRPRGFARFQPGAEAAAAAPQMRQPKSNPPLLFRYIDFTVEPGNAYRYRVRLTVRNPHFGVPADRVNAAAVREGATRVTPWSDVSPPVVVAAATQIFLSDVGRDFRRQRPRAEFTALQWDAETGTMVRGDLIASPGERIGGRLKTERINPAFGRLEPVSIAVDPAMHLIDAVPAPRLRPDEHSDLQRTSDAAEVFGIASALVLDRWGRLAVRDSLTDGRMLRRALEDWHAEREQLATALEIEIGK